MTFRFLASTESTKVRIMSVFCILLLFSFAIPHSTASTALDLNGSTAEAVRSRGFKAIEHRVTTSKSNTLSLVQALNPLINNGERGMANKDVILMVHGTGSNGKFYIANSADVKPLDYSDINAALLSYDELFKLLKNDTSANSLAYLALNFGHEVWLLNRRGTDESVNLSGPFGASTKSNLLLNQINTEYWNYSLDEQALIDLPKVVAHILKATKRSKLAYVGHSSGCDMLLMQLSIKPEFSNKISSAILWAPALYPASVTLAIGGALAGPPSFVGPVYSLRMFRDQVRLLCSNGLDTSPSCTAIPDFLYGYGGGQQILKPEYSDVMFNVVSSHEFGHLAQGVVSGKLHAYNYGDPIKNKDAYGQVEPPLYNVSKITLKTMSIWTGESDATVLEPFVKKLVKDFRVPVEAHYLDLPDYFFNHFSFVTHKEVANLAIIPSLETIELFATQW